MAKPTQPPVTLSIRHQKLMIWIAGCCFAFVGVLTLLMGELATFRCQRSPTEDQCHLTHSGLLGRVSQQTMSIADVQEATVDAKSSRNSGWRYRVMLQTQTEALPLSQTYRAGHDKHEAIAHQINTFIRDSSQPTLDIRQDNRGYHSAVGGLFLSLAGLSLLGGIRKA